MDTLQSAFLAVLQKHLHFCYNVYYKVIIKFEGHYII